MQAEEVNNERNSRIKETRMLAQELRIDTRFEIFRGANNGVGSLQRDGVLLRNAESDQVP